MDCSLPGSLSMNFSKLEYQSGLPFPSPGHLLNPGIEPRSAALRADSLLSETPRMPHKRKSSLLSSYFCHTFKDHQSLGCDKSALNSISAFCSLESSKSKPVFPRLLCSQVKERDLVPPIRSTWTIWEDRRGPGGQGLDPWLGN